MNARILISFAAYVWSVSIGTAQGYAGLGQSAAGFAVPDPDYVITFPKDAGAHPDFRIEWWYLTANLQTDSGQKFGVQWTLFRNSVTPIGGEGWQSNQVWMAHAAITTKDRHLFGEKFSRGGVGQAGVIADPFSAWIDDWELKLDDNAYRLSAGTSEFEFQLELSDPVGPVLQGLQGYSTKSSDGQASHYYSRPFMSVNGEIEITGKPLSVSGQAWLDREWSSQPLATTQTGWDWVGLSLDDGRRLMAARVRGENSFRFASLIDPNGTVQTLGDTAIRFQALDDEIPPTKWQITAGDLDLQIEALNPNAWTGTVFEYWEGPVNVTGDQTGIGYLEMTGYR